VVDAKTGDTLETEYEAPPEREPRSPS